MSPCCEVTQVMCLKPMDDVRQDFARFNDEKFEHIQDQLGVLKLADTLPKLGRALEVVHHGSSQ